jgi:hypothetical protein
MRDLGDAFVSQEVRPAPITHHSRTPSLLSLCTLTTSILVQFRLHMDVKDGQVVAAFLARWREYLTTLRSSDVEQKEGAPLDEDAVAALSDEQRQQLHRLRTTLLEDKEKD